VLQELVELSTTEVAGVHGGLGPDRMLAALARALPSRCTWLFGKLMDGAFALQERRLAKNAKW
jgi:hypothetical protein